MPAYAAAVFGHFVFKTVQAGVQCADMPHHGPARLGGIDAARAALEQLHTQARLQVTQALAGSSQRQMLAFGPGSDAAGLGNGKHKIEGDQVKTHGGNEARGHKPDLAPSPSPE